MLKTYSEDDVMPARPLKKYSQKVTERSDALDLEGGAFGKRKPDDIANSQKRWAKRSPRRKPSAFQSAVSMLTFYINRAGRQLSASRKRVLDAAKQKIRAGFGRGGAKPKKRAAS
jgi:Protein of unknown function (DUF3175)